MRKENLCISLDKNLRDKVKAAAEAERRSVSCYVRIIIRKHIKLLESKP